MNALNLAATAIVSCSLAYFVLLMASGIREIRRRSSRLSAQGRTRYGVVPGAEQDHYPVYFLVPCLNEAEVIERTVRGLTVNRGTTTIVVDDGSDDETSAIARAAGGSRTEVLRRDLPNARQGKGEALNAGIVRVRELVEDRGEDPARVIVVVMDADGRLSENALDHVLPLFDDDDVGGAQLQVRIRNRNSFLTKFQDFEFWGVASITQIGRSATGTVSLGGNAQFTRLTALDDVGERPWSDSLTEDLDLALSLALHGWRLTTTPLASVDQQAVEKVPQLLRQRTRWYQGHMMAIKRLPDIWRSSKLSHVAALELSFYCLSPWLLTLPWSVLFHYCLIQLFINGSQLLEYVTSAGGVAIVVLAWYLMAFAPAVFSGWVYWRRDRRVGIWRGLMMGNYMVLTNYISFACAWMALARVLRGETAWVKTKRSTEQAGTGPSTGLPAIAAAVPDVPGAPSVPVVPVQKVLAPASAAGSPVSVGAVLRQTET
ncbi:glycosyltransferase family 2 protein [Oerskovia flava]|uniref:glycosyltransferase family 2 protein n=1 Tax=Oerskovia flava TaxID=2986422 RepID=UPI00223F9F9A|nr:glycosyltransferase family 2 protein [Oerskovia sp. JB1-3-2]